ncbi:hypothetical protein [Marinilactibacillus sp. Marseille-P9653]|uniref:hypothetical protein n=1 Tax=Marinilactibacillus sp. Marseille-P9653 TaxID=2866583 RepID=UPI001CE3F0EA|nr:hypothetical protein [Marinilactibacillus sp. Marseille-P9653]
MREWHIQSNTISFTLLIDQITILKGSLKDWKENLSTLQSYFGHGKTDILLLENQTLIPKQDYNFYSISFSEQFISTDLLEIKKELKQAFSVQLQLSPFYKQFVEIWDDLVEEVEFLNTHSSIPYDFALTPFKDKLISDQINSNEIVSKNIITLQDLINGVELIENSSKDKLNIFAIIYPETILNSKELEEFTDYLKNHKKYTRFMILTEQQKVLSDNTFYKKQIINRLKFINTKQLLIDTLPFEFEEDLFFRAVNWSMSLVDKYRDETVILANNTVDNFKNFIYIFTLFILTNIPFIFDDATIPAPYDKYIAKLLGETV